MCFDGVDLFCFFDGVVSSFDLCKCVNTFVALGGSQGGEMTYPKLFMGMFMAMLVLRFRAEKAAIAAKEAECSACSRAFYV